MGQLDEPPLDGAAAGFFAGVDSDFADAGLAAVSVLAALSLFDAASVFGGASDFVSGFASALASDAGASDFAALSSVFAAGFDLLPLRKSVTYQPLPFNWKPAADTFLTSASA